VLLLALVVFPLVPLLVLLPSVVQGMQPNHQRRVLLQVLPQQQREIEKQETADQRVQHYLTQCAEAGDQRLQFPLLSQQEQSELQLRLYRRKVVILFHQPPRLCVQQQHRRLKQQQCSRQVRQAKPSPIPP
jgi:hypothetical protein